MQFQAGVIAHPEGTGWPWWQSAYAVWCGVMLFTAWGESWVLVAPITACFALGLVLVVQGLRGTTRERAIRAEWSRAQNEWEELRRGAATAIARGEALDDYLRSVGYRNPGAVRAIALHLSSEHAGK